MKTLATIALSLFAILASLCVVLSGICAVKGDITGTEHRGRYLLWTIFYLAIVTAAMAAIRRINRKPPDN